MAVTSSRNLQIQFSGDVTFGVIQSALDNAASPGVSEIASLGIGANTVTPPVISGITVTSLTIIPPAGNTSLITLKGVTGDTGIPLHLTDPSSIALGTTFTSLVLTVTAAVVGVRLIWA